MKIKTDQLEYHTSAFVVAERLTLLRTFETVRNIRFAKKTLTHEKVVISFKKISILSSTMSLSLWSKKMIFSRSFFNYREFCVTCRANTYIGG